MYQNTLMYSRDFKMKCNIELKKFDKSNVPNLNFPFLSLQYI